MTAVGQRRSQQENEMGIAYLFVLLALAVLVGSFVIITITAGSYIFAVFFALLFLGLISLGAAFFCEKRS